MSKGERVNRVLSVLAFCSVSRRPPAGEGSNDSQGEEKQIPAKHMTVNFGTA